MTTNATRRIVIVLPNFNGAKYLEAAIESFLHQNYENKKLIIVDGKSTDGSWDIIKKYASNKYILWINQIDTGCSQAINIANAHTDDTDIWGFMGCDDILLEGVFEKVASVFSSTSLVNGVYFDSYTVFTNPLSCVLRECPKAPFSIQSLIKYGTLVGLQNMYIDCSLVKRIGLNEKRNLASDYELYLKLAKLKNIFFVHVPMPSTYNFADNNITSQRAGASAREAVKVAILHHRISLRLIVRYLRTLLPGYGCIQGNNGTSHTLQDRAT